MSDNPVRINSREELIYLLSEAAEVEHGVMCSYLFAAFSMKDRAADGLTEQQLDAVRRWKQDLLAICAQEMVHLSLASNMLTAIGAAPQFRRPNFPQGSRYYPSGFSLALNPFNQQTLQHFLFIERPAGMEMDDPPTFEEAETPPAPVVLSDVTAGPRGFATIGELYHGIEDGFRILADRLGEEGLFIGPPRAQATTDYFNFPELIPVTDLASAIQACETIVEEGEGARGDWKEAHYGRFIRMQEEYELLQREDPHFEPARPVLANPFARIPSDSQAANLLDDPFSVEVCDLFDDCYEILLQMLARFFAHTEESEGELKALVDAAIDGMFTVIEPLGVYATTLPAGPSHPGLNAGPGFHFFRTVHTLPHRHAAWLFFQERLRELSEYSSELAGRAGGGPVLGEVASALERLAGNLAAAMESND
jgi:hypothetical protein